MVGFFEIVYVYYGLYVFAYQTFKLLVDFEYWNLYEYTSVWEYLFLAAKEPDECL